MADLADWTIRPVQPGDERQLVGLFERAFGHPVSEAHWRWKFQQLPSPVANDWLALDDDQPIFHSGGMPIRYQLADGETVAMVSVDTMTAPEYRRRGLLTRVARHMYHTWEAAGIRFVVGLINDQWGSRAPALGWEPLFPLRWQVRPLRPWAVLARRAGASLRKQASPIDRLWNRYQDRRSRAGSGIQARLVEQAGPEIDAVWARCAASAGISVVRDQAWVNWRYLTNPSFTYQVVLAERAGVPLGFAAYRIEEARDRRIGYLAEVVAPRGDASTVHSLLGYVARSLFAQGADLVAAQTPTDSWYYRTLRQAGFLWSWGDFSAEYVPLDPRLRTDAFRAVRNWTMWGGDFDSI